MKVEYHNNLQGGERVSASRVIIYDDKDNPVCCCVQLQPGRLTIVRAGDKRFDEALRMLGVRQTVIVDKIDTNKLPRIQTK